ncbi:hypothetical protein HHI36_022696, partial [Cryptolaemus montrouzieri]
MNCLETQNLYSSESYISRISQTFDAIRFKQNVILLGDVCSGKSSAIKILQMLNTDGKTENVTVINPILFSSQQLYGFMDSKYKLWKDGIITRELRKCLEGCVDNWIVFDGPIEPSWVESLYSVLEERRTITLGSGELLKNHGCNIFLFEVTDLKHASPTL